MKEPPKTTETNRLLLRQIKGTDAAAIFAYASDIETTKYMAFARHNDIAASYAFIDYTKAAWGKQEEFAFALEFKEKQKMIGTVSYKPQKTNAFIGYILHKDYWQQGLCTEAMKKLLEVIRSDSFFQGVTSCAHPDNVASIKILQSLGLQPLENLCTAEGQFLNLPPEEQRSLQFKLVL